MVQEQAEAAGPIDAFRQFFGLQHDVLVLSLAMFAFSLGFQMTNRFPTWVRVVAYGPMAAYYGGRLVLLEAE